MDESAPRDITPQEKFDRRTLQAGLHADAAYHHYEEVKALAEKETGRFAANWHRSMVRYHATRAYGAFSSAQEVGLHNLQGRYAEVAEQHYRHADGLADMADGLIGSTEWRD